MEKQDFFAIRRDCHEKGVLFEDPEFPTCNSLLPLLNVLGKLKKVDKWMRPGEICKNPKFFVDEFSRFDIKQGKIGDCWFLAAVTNLTLNPQLFNKIVCKSNSFDQEYAGIFHFHFWHYDKWESVVIDDRLPTYDNKLVYAKSTDENEFWIALLEKAFAKFKGNYKVLVKYGTICEAAEDLTGGISEKFCVKESTATNPHCCYLHISFDELEKSFLEGNFMGCFIRNKNPGEFKTHTQLVRGHAYSITNVKRIKSGNCDEIQLIRLRNPWGSEFEWNGDWCDQCSKWNYVPYKAKNDLELRNSGDGEFWISYEDFRTNFDMVEICSLTPKSLVNMNEQCLKKMKKRKIFDDKCIQKFSGKLNDCIKGLCKDRRHIMRFVKDCTTMIISISQKNVRQFMVNNSCDDCIMPMGLLMYKISEETKGFCLQTDFTENYLKENEIVKLKEGKRTPRFACRFQNIPHGTYLVVPYTSHQKAEFFVRIYCETENSLRIKKIQVCMKFLEIFWMRRFSEF